MEEPDEDGFWVGVENLSAEFPQISVSIEEEDYGLAHIYGIECTDQGKGIGTRYMERLMAVADECGMDLSTVPSVHNYDRLSAWCERLGFVFDNELRMVRIARAQHPVPG